MEFGLADWDANRGTGRGIGRGAGGVFATIIATRNNHGAALGDAFGDDGKRKNRGASGAG